MGSSGYEISFTKIQVFRYLAAMTKQYCIFVPMNYMNIKNHERKNTRVFTAFNLVFRNQLDKFIPPGI